jgi:hypothetical protein
MVVYASNQPEQFDWAINDRIDEMVTPASTRAGVGRGLWARLLWALGFPLRDRLPFYLFSV